MYFSHFLLLLNYWHAERILPEKSAGMFEIRDAASAQREAKQMSCRTPFMPFEWIVEVAISACAFPRFAALANQYIALSPSA